MIFLRVEQFYAVRFFFVGYINKPGTASEHVRAVCTYQYYTVEQRGLRQVCANAQNRQNLHCSHIQIMDVDEDSCQNLDHFALLDIRQQGYFREAFAQLRYMYVSNLTSWPVYSKGCLKRPHSKRRKGDS